jgi:short subunit dehydrogenase-like uncharacterized protein
MNGMANNWMIYGANGYTGELLAREAARRGQKPVLAGRSAERIQALASELGCEARVFDLDHIDLAGVALVVHCAGPFSRTSAPMVRACLDRGVHYLDITGEIAVFEAVFAQDEEAKRRGVVLLPGVGFDVVPTDCLAAMLHRKMPDANELWLAFAQRRGGVSRGTMNTMIESIGQGGAIRREGRIERVPMLFDVRTIPFESGPRSAMTIPWGDIATAYRTTRIPNIRVYRGASGGTIKRTKRFIRLEPLLRNRLAKKLLQLLIARRTGPNEQQRAEAHVELWGRVANARGEEATMTMRVAEGYTFTVLSALAAVERVQTAPPPAGALTPALAFGPEFVKGIAGTVVHE